MPVLGLDPGVEISAKNPFLTKSKTLEKRKFQYCFYTAFALWNEHFHKGPLVYISFCKFRSSKNKDVTKKTEEF